MTRSILCGLLGLISVVTLGALPLACQSGGVGDPCTPEDEYNPQFAGFKITEENIESRSFQCTTRICLVNHFQGRVSCPLGQSAPGEPDSPLKACEPANPTTCGDGFECVESASFAPDCNEPCPAGDAGADCRATNKDRIACPTLPAGGSLTCDNKRKLCVCESGGFTLGNVTYFCNADHVYTAHVCHKKEDGCQDAFDPNVKPEANLAQNKGKACCIPGTNTPAISPVCGQCAAESRRNAAQAVYCSCRCLRDICTNKPGKPAHGTKDPKDPTGKALLCDCGTDECEKEAATDPDFNYCDCPSGFSCTEIRKDVGLGDKQITGSYCIQDGSAFTNNSFDCGQVQGHWDATCKGTAKPGGI